MKNKKNRIDIVYSTNPDFNYEHTGTEEKDTLPPNQQKIYVQLDRRQRKGKSVTLITGSVGKDKDLQELGKKLKSKCGTGGSVKDNEILIQGDFCEKVMVLLKSEGYMVKRSGG